MYGILYILHNGFYLILSYVYVFVSSISLKQDFANCHTFDASIQSIFLDKGNPKLFSLPYHLALATNAFFGFPFWPHSAATGRKHRPKSQRWVENVCKGLINLSLTNSQELQETVHAKSMLIIHSMNWLGDKTVFWSFLWTFCGIEALKCKWKA